MKDIKFRGISKGCFIYGSYATDNKDYHAILSPVIGTGEMLSQPVDVKTIGQFTGLKDGNNIDIYNGDIVRYKPYSNLGHSKVIELGIVEWGETGDSDGWSHGKHYEWIVDDDSLADVADSDYKSESFFEIIGNIHENPELLESDND